MKKLLALFFLLTAVFFSSCQFELDIEPVIESDLPILTTKEVTGISRTGAITGGNITNDNGETITARGICWSTEINPTIEDNKTENGMGAGEFTSNLTGLEQFTTYFVRAYATNKSGTAYGSTYSFVTQGPFTDSRDGKQYETVLIGNQEWMAENLAYEAKQGSIWAYDYDTSSVETYGWLYDWNTAQEVCPEGWHLPSDIEWNTLIESLGGIAKAGGALKNISGWNTPNVGATNSSGFTGLPGGVFHNNWKFFEGVGVYGVWWSSIEGSNPSTALNYRLFRSSAEVNLRIDRKTSGFSCRCVRD